MFDSDDETVVGRLGLSKGPSTMPSYIDIQDVRLMYMEVENLHSFRLPDRRSEPNLGNACQWLLRVGRRLVRPPASIGKPTLYVLANRGSQSIIDYYFSEEEPSWIETKVAIKQIFFDWRARDARRAHLFDDEATL